VIQAVLTKLKGEGLGARARRGSIFVVLQFGSSNILRLLSNLVLTRLLFPEAFGLMALVQVVMSVLAMLSDLGIGASVVQHKRGEELPFLRTAWTLQVLRGLLLALLMVLMAPYAAEFYEEPLLAQLLLLAALTLIIDGCLPLRVMLAERNMTIGHYTMVTIAAQVLSIVLTVLLAWKLQSVWALVIGGVANAAFRNILARIFMPGPSDGFAFERSALRDIISFGAFIFIGSVAGYAINYGDRAILGKLIELDLLGIYSVAAMIGTVPLLLTTALTFRIVFPLYSRRPPTESAENQRMIFKARYMLTAAMFALTLVLVVFGDPLVRLLYDPRYHLAGGITVLIAMGILPFLVVASHSSVLLANGRSDMYALLTAVVALFRLIAIYFGVVHFGVAGAALGPVAATILQYPIMVALIYRYRAWDPVHDLVFGLVAAAIFALGWWLNQEAILAVFAV
jgi:O-antigen/teichoic acid export membrane protein